LINSSPPQRIFKPTIRRIEILDQKQNNYFQSSFIFDEQQRNSLPELQVRRLSQDDWPYLSAYALPSILSASLSSRKSNLYEL
jgi:hypothetical protein